MSLTPIARRKFSFINTGLQSIVVAVAFCCCALAMNSGAQTVVTPPPAIVPPAQPENPLSVLTWDSTLKESSPKPGAPTADFIFSVTNPSDHPVVIDHLKTSCGCTAAKLPSEPWVMAPGTNGQINVTVNLAGKMGTFFKTVFVFATNGQKVDLNLKVNMPENPEMARMRNQQIAMADHQMVFKNECASCHADKTRGLMGQELYDKACGICHEANPRDSKVTNLHALNHPVDAAFWKTMISEGRQRTMMPGFAKSIGGPLDDAQIASLTEFCSKTFVPVLTASSTPQTPGLMPPPSVKIKN